MLVTMYVSSLQELNVLQHIVVDEHSCSPWRKNSKQGFIFTSTAAGAPTRSVKVDCIQAKESKESSISIVLMHKNLMTRHSNCVSYFSILTQTCVYLFEMGVYLVRRAPVCTQWSTQLLQIKSALIEKQKKPLWTAQTACTKGKPAVVFVVSKVAEREIAFVVDDCCSIKKAYQRVKQTIAMLRGKLLYFRNDLTAHSPSPSATTAAEFVALQMMDRVDAAQGLLQISLPK